MFFLWNLFWKTLTNLGLVGRKARLLLLGLDNAGKTTLLRVLRDNKFVPHEPTRHAQSEEVRIGNVTFTAYDLGGHAAARRLWQSYYASVDAVVFLVDATDRERLPEVHTELQQLLLDDALRSASILVLGNKTDVVNALQQTELERYLLDDLPSVARSRPLKLFMCSVYKRAGYADGFRWLSSNLPPSADV